MRYLEFEKPIAELNEKIEQLRALSGDDTIDMDEEIARIESRAHSLKEKIYESLTPTQVVQVSRHPNRPDCLSLFALLSDTFVSLHGDRAFRDDPSIVGGLAQIGSERVVLIGHQKGHDTKENIYRNFGMPHPEGYRKALRLMKLAEKFQLPVITFIDTPGAYPGLEAEERGQSEAIARNLKEMSVLEVPIVTFVLGEGGSGGALAIGVSDRVFMLQYSIYSVISPEGCASILFRDAKNADKAARSLKITAEDVVSLGIADGIVPEPLGGAHYDWKLMSDSISKVILETLSVLKQKDTSTLLEERYQKFRRIGFFEGE